MILVFINCTPFKMIKKFNSGKPIYKEDICIIPFKLSGHKILVNVKLNNSKKDFIFLLDTGALTFISPNAANELGLKKGAEVPTMKKSEKAYLTKIDSIALGKMIVSDFVLPIIDIQAVFDSSLLVDGFIGSDFLRFFNTTIDYDNKQIVLKQNNIKAEQDEREYKSELKIPFPFRFPTVNMKINNSIDIDGIIDTGSPFALVLPLSFVGKLDEQTKKKLIKSKGAMAKWPSTVSNYNYSLRIDELLLGELKINNLPIIFAELPKPFNSALIGKNFLDKFLFTINYPGKEMTFFPRKNNTFKMNIFSTGLKLRKGKNNKTYVQGFWEGSPADNNFIKPGDEIIAINNIEISELSGREINTLLENDQIENIELKIRNADNFQVIDLKKVMLFP